MAQIRDWPGNDLSRLTEKDRILHDHLCELLSDRMNEQDVCTASVGIWGAISVMRDLLNLSNLERDMYETRIKDQKENIERLQTLSSDFNKQAKLLEEFAQCLENHKNAYRFSYEKEVEGSLEWQFDRVMESYQKYRSGK